MDREGVCQMDLGKPNAYGFIDEPEPVQDQDTVEDRWTDLLQLIIQYGSERFTVGYHTHKAYMASGLDAATLKVKADGNPGSDLLVQIVRQLRTLQREAGDD